MESQLNMLLAPLLEILAGKYGVIAQALGGIAVFVGTLRLFFKPIMEAAEKIVLATPSKNDDIALVSVKKSIAFRTFVFLMDFLLSIKIPIVEKIVKS